VASVSSIVADLTYEKLTPEHSVMTFVHDLELFFKIFIGFNIIDEMPFAFTVLP